MRYLALLVFISSPGFAAGAQGTPVTAEKVELSPYLAAEAVSEQWSSASSHLLILGALEKVNHVLQPERSEVVAGRRFQETLYLPEARRTEQVFDHYRQQLLSLGELLFECDGRACGSSSYWANRVFEEAVLYGPEQYQKYAIVRRNDGRGYLAVYVGQRATRKIYVHLVHFLTVVE